MQSIYKTLTKLSLNYSHQNVRHIRSINKHTFIYTTPQIFSVKNKINKCKKVYVTNSVDKKFIQKFIKTDKKII